MLSTYVDSKFFAAKIITQTQILKMSKKLSVWFERWLNNVKSRTSGLGRHSDKMSTENATKNARNLANQQNKFEMFWKKSPYSGKP